MWDVVEFTIGPYLEILGQYFWAFLLLLLSGAVYVRMRNFGPAYVTLAVGATIMSAVLPAGPFDLVLYFAVALGIVYTGYRLFVSSGGY